MCRNQLFYFQALWPNTGDVAVAEEDLVNILEAIRNHASKLHEAGNPETACEQNYQSSVSALGVLTSLARGQWARARNEMIDSSKNNAESFKVVDSALFVLVLDDYIPRTKHEAAANMLHGSYRLSEHTPSAGGGSKEYQSGSCTNRWYDKLQVRSKLDGMRNKHANQTHFGSVCTVGSLF
jgi:carnitine O-acetyltransferase